MNWTCDNCGKKHELGIEELYLERLVKDAGLKIVGCQCPVCRTVSPDAYMYEEGLRLLELLATSTEKQVPRGEKSE